MKKLSIALFILIVTVCRVQAAGPALYLSDRDGTVLDVMNRDGFFQRLGTGVLWSAARRGWLRKRHISFS